MLLVEDETAVRELVEKLAEVRPESRVLYICGYTAGAMVSRGVLDPGMFFLGKPFTAEALARKVREVLDSPRGRPAASP